MFINALLQCYFFFHCYNVKFYFGYVVFIVHCCSSSFIVIVNVQCCYNIVAYCRWSGSQMAVWMHLYMKTLSASRVMQGTGSVSQISAK